MGNLDVSATAVISIITGILILVFARVVFSKTARSIVPR